MFFTLAAICLFGSVMTADNVEIVATALYYADPLGRILLVCDELPFGTKVAIHQDFLYRVKNKFRLRIVPAFENREDIPYKADILTRLRDIYPKIYIANISNTTSVQIMEKLIKKTKLHKRNYVSFNKNEYPLESEQDDKEEEDLLENEAAVNYIETTINTNGNSSQHPFVQIKSLHNPDGYFPNSVIYAIEKPCVVRSEFVDCNQGNSLLTKFISGRKGE